MDVADRALEVAERALTVVRPSLAIALSTFASASLSLSAAGEPGFAAMSAAIRSRIGSMSCSSGIPSAVAVRIRVLSGELREPPVEFLELAACGVRVVERVRRHRQVRGGRITAEECVSAVVDREPPEPVVLLPLPPKYVA